MSLMAETSPHHTMLAQRLLENGAFRKRKFRSNIEHSSFVDIPSDNHPSDVNKRRNVAVKRDFPPNCGPLASTRSDMAISVAAIAAVPLRSLPSIDANQDCEKSLASLGKDVDVGQNMANENENSVGSINKEDVETMEAIAVVPSRSLPSFDVKEDGEKSLAMWKEDVETLTTLIAQAKESINLLGTNFSLFKRTLDENLLETSKLEDNKDEICVLPPQEPEKSSGQGIENVDLDLDECVFVGEKEKSTIDEPETSSGQRIENVDLDLDECAFVGEKEKLSIDEPGKSSGQGMENVDLDLDEYSFVVEKEKLTIYEPESYQNHEELINLTIVQHDEPRRSKMMEALMLFEEQYNEVMYEHKLRGDEKASQYAHIEAAMRLKSEGKWICAEKPFGHVRGVEIGDAFGFRAELAVIGLHHQFVCGIDEVLLEGKKFATSVVNSGRYENSAKGLDVLIYSGQGGFKTAGDQKLEKGNLALMNSMEMAYPVRVTSRRKVVKAANTLGMSNASKYVYVYDGLYTVNTFWHERDQKGNLVYKFELHRMLDQPRSHQAVGNSRKLITCKEVCVMDDISQGKENLRIRAMNGVDNDKPPPFTYTTNIVYPNWYRPIEPVGCSCVNGCSDSLQCPCVLKNGGEIPFTEKGAITRAKHRVHECGPPCKCPPSCMNRVSQNGPHHQLEIFKTESRGWGLRSRNYISSGSFICEYVGELLRDDEAELRVGDDEYLFDIYDDGYAIDAAMYGNIGRFINHSCSPNLYAQEILYDHDDKRMPHIMFFATKNIPLLQELTYDYNYKMNRICDANGNIKTRACYCGSRDCTGRMY